MIDWDTPDDHQNPRPPLLLLLIAILVSITVVTIAILVFAAWAHAQGVPLPQYVNTPATLGGYR